MVDYAQATGCLTRRLPSYFREELSAIAGIAIAARGSFLPRCPGDLQSARPGRVKTTADLRAEGHRTLATHRHQTRFLCGLSPPATTRAKLIRRPAFGLLDDVSFAEVLALTDHEGKASEDA